MLTWALELFALVETGCRYHYCAPRIQRPTQVVSDWVIEHGSVQI